jgi:hypothetical protein
VLREGELPVVIETVFMAAHTLNGSSIAIRNLSRIDNYGPCPRAIEKDPELETLAAVRVTGLYGQHDGEYGTADRFHVTHGSVDMLTLALSVVFVESVAVDMDRNAHFWQAVCAHGGGRVVVA